MEDWQEWQIRADQIALDLNSEVDALDAEFLAPEISEFNYRGFWPRFRDLKERVRTAPAIRLEPKLDLERRLRGAGSRAYRAQESVYARSGERKTAVIQRIVELRQTAERENTPRGLRTLRRDFDRLREEFDAGGALVPPDRQAVWDAWREANQFAWNRLVGMWSENEQELRQILDGARQAIERGNPGAARQAVARFFDTLKTREAKQDAVNAMKAEIEEIRRDTEQVEERTTARSAPVQQMPSTPVADTWRAELARNREVASRLTADATNLEQQLSDADSILEQAMLRGTLVEKRRKITELERSNRALEQKIEQTEEVSLIFSA
ncbi:MAG: hypothetical protein ACRDFX_10890 [Chloroflexota bacterium]